MNQQVGDFERASHSLGTGSRWRWSRSDPTKNLVKLSKRRSDGRVTEVHLTPLGKRCVERERGTAGVIYRRAMRDLTSSEIAVLNGLTRRIFANLSKQASDRGIARPV
jgi:hypothetical protein